MQMVSNQCQLIILDGYSLTIVEHVGWIFADRCWEFQLDIRSLLLTMSAGYLLTVAGQFSWIFTDHC